MLKSIDGCASWFPSNGTLLLAGVGALAIAPSNASILYAGTYDGVFRSADAGVTWVAASGGLPANPSISALVVDPAMPARLYAASQLGGVFRSTDSGTTWDITATGLPPGAVWALVVHPTTSGTLYGATGNGVFRSTDQGSSWTNSGLAGLDLHALAADPASPGIFYAGSASAGVFKSTDGGSSWLPAGTGITDPAVDALAVDPGTTTTVYAGTKQGGVFKSTNAGGSWAPASAGLSNPFVAAIGVDPSNPAHVCVANRRGYGPIFRSIDSAGTWNVTQTGMAGLWVTALAFDASQPATVYAGASGIGREVFRSTDRGLTWVPTRTATTPFYADHQALVIDPSAVATLYTGTPGGVFKSTNSGGAWAFSGAGLSTFDTRALAIGAGNPATLYAGTWGGGVFKSTDAGAAWGPVNSNLPGNLFVRALALDPVDPATLYVGTAEFGVFKSTDSGGTWAAANAGLDSPGVAAIAIDSAQPATLYVGTEGGVFRSTNAGAAWTHSAGLSDAVRALAIDSSDHSRLYAGTNARVFRSTDAGVSWARTKGGRASGAVYALAVDPTGATIVHAGIVGASVRELTPAPPKGDIDGNGSPDLYFTSVVDRRRSKVWLMNAVARIAESDITPDAASAAWSIRGVDDFDADGRTDLVFWNETSGQVEFWLMNGTSRPGPPVPLGGGAVLPANWEPSATADFNDDGWPDLVWRNHSSQKIVIWTMNGTTKTGNLLPVPGQAADANWTIVAARDYDNDGSSDFLWYNTTSGKLVVWYMDPNVVRYSGQFTSPSAAGDANWKVVASGDYSGSMGPGTPQIGSPDIVWRNATSGNQVVWHMTFDGTRVYGEFTLPAANAPALAWAVVGPK